MKGVEAQDFPTSFFVCAGLFASGIVDVFSVARDLIDIGMKEFYQLQGRSAESLFEEIRKLRPKTPEYRLAYLRMAIYYSENDPADPKLLHPQEWQDA